jgi:hypothetical protein
MLMGSAAPPITAQFGAVSVQRGIKRGASQLVLLHMKALLCGY